MKKFIALALVLALALTLAAVPPGAEDTIKIKFAYMPPN